MYNNNICNLKKICRILNVGILWACLTMAVIGCAGLKQPPVMSPPQDDNKTVKVNPPVKRDAPKTGKEVKVTPPKSIAAWIPKGSGAFIVDTNRIFHGIGGATSSSNPILLRASADNRSRDELSKVLTQFTTFVLETYWNKGGGRDSSDVGNFEVLNEAFLAVVQNILSSSRIAGHWQDPKSGEFYALCQLTLAELKAAIANDTRLDRRSRDYFLENAESLYDQFSQEDAVV